MSRELRVLRLVPRVVWNVIGVRWEDDGVDLRLRLFGAGHNRAPYGWRGGRNGLTEWEVSRRSHTSDGKRLLRLVPRVV